jgi:antirestriction protein ArdC
VIEAEGEADGEEGNGSSRRIPFAREYFVFNVSQVDGVTPSPTPTIGEEKRIGNAERFFRTLGADVRHGGNQAFYAAESDHIQLPWFEQFKDAASYYSVRAHETTHWSGAPQRLNRDLAARFGSEAYAAEELVAELGSAFLCGALGVPNEPREDHAPYVAAWLK